MLVRSLGSALLLLIGLLVVPPAGAATLAWDGIFRIGLEDDGTGVYTGAVEDVTLFSGDFVFGDTCTGSCIVEPFPPDATNYVFPGGTGSITGLSITTLGQESSVEIGDESVVTVEEADLIAMLGFPISAGEIVDTWTVASEKTVGSELLIWEVSFLYVTTNPFSSTAYTSTPPPNWDLVTFLIEEADGDVFLGVGEVTLVPEPDSRLQLGAGCLGLLVLGRRARRR